MVNYNIPVDLLYLILFYFILKIKFFVTPSCSNWLRDMGQSHVMDSHCWGMYEQSAAT